MVSMPRHSAHCSSVRLENPFSSAGHERNALSVAVSDELIDIFSCEFGVLFDRVLLEPMLVQDQFFGGRFLADHLERESR